MAPESEVESGSPVLVRPAAAAELAAAGELAVNAYLSAGVLRADDEYRHTVADAAARHIVGTVLVAERSGELVGTASMSRAGLAFAEIALPGESEVRMLAVTPTAWGHGVADELVRGAMDHARAEGSTALVCCVVDSNVPAHRLYARHGFTRLPERDWCPVQGVALQAYRVPLHG